MPEVDNNSPPGPDGERLTAEAVAAAYITYGDELKRMLRGVLGDPQLVADALQAALVKLVERGHETQEDTRKAWLFRVAMNEALVVRRRKIVADKASKKLATGGQSHNTDETTGGLDGLVKAEDIEAVRKALVELPANQREVVQLRIYENMKFAEIADHLNIPLGTALARMRTAIATLKQKLAP